MNSNSHDHVTVGIFVIDYAFQKLCKKIKFIFRNLSDAKVLFENLEIEWEREPKTSSQTIKKGLKKIT